MPYYEYRCAECRDVFGEERSMSEAAAQPTCTACGSEKVNRIWNAVLRTGGRTPDVGQGTRTASTSTSSGGGGGCGSCSSHSCGTCH